MLHIHTMYTRANGMSQAYLAAAPTRRTEGATLTVNPQGLK